MEHATQASLPSVFNSFNSLQAIPSRREVCTRAVTAAARVSQLESFRVKLPVAPITPTTITGNPPIFTTTARDESTVCKRGFGRVSVARGMQLCLQNHLEDDGTRRRIPHSDYICVGLGVLFLFEEDRVHDHVELVGSHFSRSHTDYRFHQLLNAV